MNAAAEFWLPQGASNLAVGVDRVFTAYFWVALLVFVGVSGAAIAFSLRWRRKREGQPAVSQKSHNTALEITWTLIPGVVFLGFYFWGLGGFVHMQVAPVGAMEINVTAQKWKWEFGYPGGLRHDTLVVPAHRPVKLVMNSRDVIHSFFVPAFRTKKDVIPNRYTTLWFTPTREGSYPVLCTEYCGLNHSAMLTAVRVVSPGAYAKWLQEQAAALAEADPVELGRILYARKGCNACHSLDGSKMVGPSWQGIFGSKTKFQSGDVRTVDEEYIRQSIVDPHAQIVAGFQPVMPVYRGQMMDVEMDALIAFIKSLR